MFFLFEKKLLIASICVSPIPSKSNKFRNNVSLLFCSYNLENSLMDIKKFASIFAFSCPICLIPIEYINLFNAIFFELLIAFLSYLLTEAPIPQVL